MIWWGVKMADFGDGGGRAGPIRPPCPPLGAAPNIWAMVLNQTRGESVGGVQGVPSPWGNSLLPGTPLGRRHAPGDIFDQNQKKEAKLSKLSNFSVTFSKTVPSAPLYKSFA